MKSHRGEKIDPRVRAVLEPLGIEVVRATYTKQIMVADAAKDQEKTIDFRSGTVRVIDVETWLEATEVQYRRTSSRRFWFNTIVGLLTLAAALAAVALPFFGK